MLHGVNQIMLYGLILCVMLLMPCMLQGQSNVNHMCQSEKQIVCKLTTRELQNRKATVIQKLKLLVLDKENVSNGYRFKFSASDQVLDQLIDFVKTERVCCDFFTFSLIVENTYVWLTITGPEGAKEFLEHEVGF
jgi:hypothetical protein